MFTLTIETDNAAFERSTVRFELARILSDVNDPSNRWDECKHGVPA